MSSVSGGFAALPPGSLARACLCLGPCPAPLSAAAGLVTPASLHNAAGEFDGEKRNCRRTLQQHNERRRRQRAAAGKLGAEAGSSHKSGREEEPPTLDDCSKPTSSRGSVQQPAGEALPAADLQRGLSEAPTPGAPSFDDDAPLKGGGASGALGLAPFPASSSAAPTGRAPEGFDLVMEEVMGDDDLMALLDWCPLAPQPAWQVRGLGGQGWAGLGSLSCASTGYSAAQPFASSS